MLTNATLLESALSTLESVFAVHQTTVTESWERDCQFSAEEAAVASLHFFGDFSGQLVLGFPKATIRQVIEHLLDRFEIEVPVEDSLVFAEMINIYAANLSTALRRYGVSMSIAAPDFEVGPAKDAGEHLLTLRVDTAENLRFILCFYSTLQKDSRAT